MKQANITAWYDRDPKSINGRFTLQDQTGNPILYRHNGKEFLFKQMQAASGQKGYEGSSWVRGRSPIPYLRNAYLWLKPIGVGLKPGIKGIGEAWPISTSLMNHDIIIGPNGAVRTLIRLHFDNAFQGSAGCVVLPYTNGTKREREIADALFFYLHELSHENDYLLLNVL